GSVVPSENLVRPVAADAAVVPAGARAADADAGARIDLPSQVAKLPRKCDVGGRIMRDGVLIGFPGTIFFVADFPVFPAIGSRPTDTQKVEPIVGNDWRRRAQRRPIRGRVPIDVHPSRAVPLLADADRHIRVQWGIAIREPSGRLLRTRGP